MTRGRPKIAPTKAPTIEATFAGAGFADVPASPLQLALCRAAEGQPIGTGLTDAEVQNYFGCGRSMLGVVVPVLVIVICGVRSGKSMFAVAGCTRDVLAADCSGLKAHEIPRHAIIAPNTDAATATFRLLCGVWRASALLSAMIVGEPTSDTLTVRRPDGRIIEIVVVAASRGAVSVRNRWLAGFTFEEVSGFGIEASGAAVNVEELLRAGETRLLPRTQGRLISNPYGKQGLLWNLYRKHFGKSGRVLVLHAPTRAMNPSFPQVTIDEIRARDADAANEYDAKWIDGATAFLSSAQIDACTRPAPLVREVDQGAYYASAMDAGTRANAWTLVVARAVRIGADAFRVQIALAHEWKGSRANPLSPEVVLGEIAKLVAPFPGADEIGCDGYSFDGNRDLGAQVKLRLVERKVAERDEGYAALSSLVATGRLELAPVPNCIADLKSIKKVVTPNGFKIVLPHTPDGRHADFAPSVALAALGAIGRATSPGSQMVAALQAVHARGGANALALDLGADMSALCDFAELRRLVGR